MRPKDQAEFVALRATIRERGTARVVLFFVVIAVWAALTVATTAVIVLPIAALLPLLVLAAGFEATSSLHIGVERIGRYIQAAHEDQPLDDPQGKPGWETTAMKFGARGRTIGPDALFSAVYVLAGVANFLPVALTAQAREEMVAIGALHALFVWRVLTLRRAVATQRERELAVFREILGQEQDASSSAPSFPRERDGEQ
jgi:hypothetical protein